jgi:putative intracellular protease/amidase
MPIKKVLIPIPSKGCDPSEVGVPWKLMSEVGFEIVFATPNGEKATTDNIMLTGEKLGIWKSVLPARKDAVLAFTEMEKSSEFCNPIKYQEVKEEEFDAIYLPGGHDKPVKEYLESKLLQQKVVDFFETQKPVGAICHGVVVVARSISKKSGKSVIHNYKTTSLLKSQERMGYIMTRMWLKDYYLTYPEQTVEDEVRSALVDGHNFVSGPTPLFRDSPNKLSRGFFVRDQNYISARWPGDLYSFSNEFIKMIQNS